MSNRKPPREVWLVLEVVGQQRSAFLLVGHRHRIGSCFPQQSQCLTENHLVKSGSCPKWSAEHVRFFDLWATKSICFPLARNNSDFLADKPFMKFGYLALQRSRGVGRIAGWGLVRTHAAGAARAVPSPSTPRPLGAPLLSCEAPSEPAPEQLGAFASRSHQIGGASDAIR
jgi:hypothetical protein